MVVSWDNSHTQWCGILCHSRIRSYKGERISKEEGKKKRCVIFAVQKLFRRAPFYFFFAFTEFCDESFTFILFIQLSSFKEMSCWECFFLVFIKKNEWRETYLSVPDTISSTWPTQWKNSIYLWHQNKIKTKEKVLYFETCISVSFDKIFCYLFSSDFLFSSFRILVW